MAISAKNFNLSLKNDVMLQLFHSVFKKIERFNDLEHYLFPNKDCIFDLLTDFRDNGCPECDPSIKKFDGVYTLCEKHFEEYAMHKFLIKKKIFI